jgi:CDGSH-type Zn-finger protein
MSYHHENRTIEPVEIVLRRRRGMRRKDTGGELIICICGSSIKKPLCTKNMYNHYNKSSRPA